MQYQKHCPGCYRRKDGTAVCTHCGYDESSPRSPIFLPHGTMLAGQYRVGRVLGKPGGFGITYLGWDVNLQQRVAIKEFMPTDIAARVPESLNITVHTQDQRRGFDSGKDYFLREARTVAQLDHPNIVRVRNFFNANDTAYMVMDYYEGMTLDDYLSSQRPTLDASVAVSIARPILDGLRYVHEKGLVHRDIKPHNLYLAAVGRPILLDFGAARQAMGNGGRSLSVVLTEGYAPLEQYQRRSTQGPWTDVYGVAATLFRTMTGQAPPFALDRLQKDPLEEPHGYDAIPENLRAAMRKALAVRAEDRYQTAQEFMDALDAFKSGLKGPAPEPITPVDPNLTRAADEPLPPPAGLVPPNNDPGEPDSRRETAIAVGGITSVSDLKHLPPPRPAAPKPAPPPPPPPPPPPAPPANPITKALPWALAVIVLAVAWFVFFDKPAPYKPVTPAGAADKPALSAAAKQQLPAGVPNELVPATSGPAPLTAAQRGLLPRSVALNGGSQTLADGRDQKVLRVGAFRIAPSEVTVAQFRLFVEHTGYVNPLWASYPCEGGGSSVSQSGWDKPGYTQTEDHPVTCVSWRDARAFAGWLSDRTGKFWRLPTESEWEFAIRSGTRTRFWWGTDFKSDMAQCSGCPGSPPGKPSIVQSRQPSSFGLYDMADNVREWTCSSFAPYPEGKAEKCTNVGESAKVAVRGGSWKDELVTLTSAHRGSMEPDRRNAWTGFRVVQE